MENRKLTIELTPEGAIYVTGPLQDKVFCYGLLELAKDVVRAQVVEKKSVLEVAAFPPNLRGNH